MKALCFDSFGGPEVLKYQTVPDAICKSTDVIVRTKAIGLNFADIYRRKGNYHLKGAPPYILGYEATGIVERVGEEITEIRPGDRVAFADVPFANAELVAVPFEHVIPLPQDITYETAAALLLQGLTAEYLTHDSFKVTTGHDVVVHAAAGGVGQLLIQIAKQRGATVIGLTSSEAKRQIALSQGADHVFLYSEEWKLSTTRSTNKQLGADVVYDSVGSTLQDSFDVTKTGGTVVFYGMAGGDPKLVDPRMLMDTSKTLTGGDLWNVITSRDERITRSNKLFDWVRNRQLTVSDPTVFPLANGAEAHRLLESRESTGKILLIP